MLARFACSHSLIFKINSWDTTSKRHIAKHHHVEIMCNSACDILICMLKTKTSQMEYSFMVTARYSKGSLFRRFGLIWRFVIPKVRYSEGPLFRRFVNPKMKERSLIRNEIRFVNRKWNKIPPPPLFEDKITLNLAFIVKILTFLTVKLSKTQKIACTQMYSETRSLWFCQYMYSFLDIIYVKKGVE